jgi:hypothetical protein
VELTMALTFKATTYRADSLTGRYVVRAHSDGEFSASYSSGDFDDVEVSLLGNYQTLDAAIRACRRHCHGLAGAARMHLRARAL